jgi:hypothetical protein
MAKFKIGDKVRVIKSNRPGSYYGDDLNAMGTVVNIEKRISGKSYYVVDFGEEKKFTWKTMKTGKKSGRLYFEDEIALVAETRTQNWKIVIVPDGDKTTALYYENGKIAKKAEVKRYFKDEYSADAAVRALLEKLDLPCKVAKKSAETLGFDWKKFIDGDLVVRFSCEEDYVEFLKQCGKRGLIWNHGEKPTKFVDWKKNRTIAHNPFKHEKLAAHALGELFGIDFKHLSMGETEGDFEMFTTRKVPVVDWKPEVEESPFKVGDIVELIEHYMNHSKGTRGKITHIKKANLSENGYLVDVITERNGSFSVFSNRLKKVN